MENPMKIKNAVCYSFDLNDEGALAYMRLIGPLRGSGINIINGIENNQTIVNRVSEGDVVIIQREFPKQFDNYKKIIELAHKERKPVIFDLDDLLLYLPDNHQHRQSARFGPSLLPMFQAIMEADLVSVSTPKLRDVLAKYNDNIVVLPNYFNDNLWRLTPPALKNSSGEVLTIGFMGTSTHKPDLEYIAPVLLDLIKRYPQKLRFHFWGVQPPAQLESLPQVESTPWYSFVYKDFAELFQTQYADIFIAPLVDNLFNRCKSSLKFFEYSALGAPGVFSRLDPYTDVVKHGHDGLLASSLDEWTDCLIQLIENDELRFQLATNAQATIRKKWLLSKNAFRWKEAFQSAIGTISSNREQNNSIVSIVKSINLQLFETFNKNELEQLGAEVKAQQAEQQIASLNQVVFDRDVQISIINQAIADRDGQIASLNQVVFDRDVQISIINQAIADRDGQIADLNQGMNAIMSSWPWKLTAPLRWLNGVAHRAGGSLSDCNHKDKK
jgi:glycosyltransferase involved in cell wall biosynthesis